MTFQFSGQARVHAVHVFHGIVAAADAGLIRHNKQFEARVLQAVQRLRRAGKKHDPLRIAQVFLLLDDGAVAVQKNGATHKTLHPFSRLKLASNSSGATVAVPTLPTTPPAA